MDTFSQVVSDDNLLDVEMNETEVRFPRLDFSHIGSYESTLLLFMVATICIVIITVILFNVTMRRSSCHIFNFHFTQHSTATSVEPGISSVPAYWDVCRGDRDSSGAETPPPSYIEVISKGQA